ncbi:MAG: 50S ribosomal protein L29 [Bdellovibrionota bacterium]
MKYSDVSDLAEKDLAKKTKEIRIQLFEARMKNSLGQLANPMSIREMRRDVARLNTAKAAKKNKSAKAGAKG